jgi:hypothetical protein
MERSIERSGNPASFLTRESGQYYKPPMFAHDFGPRRFNRCARELLAERLNSTKA